MYFRTESRWGRLPMVHELGISIIKAGRDERINHFLFQLAWHMKSVLHLSICTVCSMYLHNLDSDLKYNNSSIRLLIKEAQQLNTDHTRNTSEVPWVAEIVHIIIFLNFLLCLQHSISQRKRQHVLLDISLVATWLCASLSSCTATASMTVEIKRMRRTAVSHCFYLNKCCKDHVLCNLMRTSACGTYIIDIAKHQHSFDSI